MGRKVNVFMFGVLAGTLEEKADKYVFTYNENYKGKPLSLSIPTSVLVHENKELPPYFKSLAPGFNTEHGTYIGYDFILFARAIGISEKMALKLLHNATNKNASVILDTINASYMKYEHKEKVSSCINLRLKALKETDYHLFSQ